jgi:hypothetical protein
LKTTYDVAKQTVDFHNGKDVSKPKHIGNTVMLPEIFVSHSTTHPGGLSGRFRNRPTQLNSRLAGAGADSFYGTIWGIWEKL